MMLGLLIQGMIGLNNYYYNLLKGCYDEMVTLLGWHYNFYPQSVVLEGSSLVEL